ncbi:hypothetical protein Tco_0472534 [Tanacetum coccineum]
MDAVRVCLLIVAELVFMGKEDMNCIPKHILSLVEDFDSWNDYPWGEYMWEIFYKRTVNVVAIHRADHLKKKKQNSDYYPTYNLYGFAWAFKIWILESYPNSRKWWSKKDNVLPRALAWSNVTKFEKNNYNRLFGPDSNPNLELYATRVEKKTGWFIASNCVDLQHKFVSVVSVLSADSHEGLNETRVANNKMILLEGGDGCFDSEGGATNPESNKDKPPTLADVLDEVRALRKEVALVKFDDARISKLERILNDNFMFHNDISPNGNHNAVNQGLSGSANHPMLPVVIGIHKADGKNNSLNGNQNGVKKGLSCSANDPLSTCLGADILDGEVADALIRIHKADGKNDSPNVNHNVVNKGLSSSTNDPMSTCSSPDMDNGEVSVAGMGIHKTDGQNDIPNANDNVVNQGIMVWLMIPCKLCHVNEFADDYMDVLNDEENIPNYSLDDMKLQDEEEKLISTPAPVNHQQAGYVTGFSVWSTSNYYSTPPQTISRSVNRDFIAPLEFLKDVSGEPKIRPINELMTLEVFVEHLDLWIDLMWYFREPDADWAMVSLHFLTCTLNGSMIDYYSSGVRYPVAWRDVEKLSIDGGSITSAPAIMTMPSNHFLKLLGFKNHDLPIVEAATGHIMGHTVQVYMGNSQSFENVAIQGNVGSFLKWRSYVRCGFGEGFQSWPVVLDNDVTVI